MNCTDWVIHGSNGELMHGTVHQPQQSPAGVVLLAHGFKGYKDYGMFPWLATRFASIGYTTHRFNFSHSGMLDGAGDFERPDLFELDTWNKQVEDLEVLTATLKQEGLPLILVGHSRGGVACLLATGRGKVNASHVITLSAPSTCNSISPEQQELLLREGSIVSPSSRTGQELRVGKGFLQEQLDDSSAHDLLPLVSTIQEPVLVIHGCNDPSVPHIAATEILSAAKNSSLVSVEGGDHVFNTSNPFPALQGPSAQLGKAWDSMKSWLQS